MHSPNGAALGAINAVYFFGALCMVHWSALGARRYGRKPGLYLGISLTVASAVTQSAWRNRYIWIACRFLMGCASSLFSFNTPMLLSEFALDEHRSLYTGLWNSFNYLGTMTGAWVVFGARNMSNDWAWRIPVIFQIALPLLATPGLLLCPESPRWLVAQHRQDDARIVLSNRRPETESTSSLVTGELHMIETNLCHETAKGRPFYREMFHGSLNRRRVFISITLAFFSQWTGNGVVTYYLSLILDRVGIEDAHIQTLLSGCLQVFNLIVALGAFFFLKKMSPRTLSLVSATIMFVSFGAITGLSAKFEQSGNYFVGRAVLPCLFVFYLGYDIALTPLVPTFPSEIWPYQYRHFGMHLNIATVLAFSLLNIFVSPIAFQAWGWKFYIVFLSVLVAFGACAYWVYPSMLSHGPEPVLEGVTVVVEKRRVRETESGAVSQTVISEPE